MTRRQILVVGHADGDGHAIAEQTRRNLAQVASFDVAVVVDPTRTQGHASWQHLDLIEEVEAAEWVFFVDLMFSPTTFVREAEGFVAFAEARPQKTFFVIDHHPLPQRRIAASNIRSVYRPDVFECTLGPRSGLMIIAAINERQSETIAPIRQEHHDVIARGVRRAAAPGGALSGKRLMDLLAAGRWNVLYDLGADDGRNHRLIRGRRSPNDLRSEALADAENVAENLGEVDLKGTMVSSEHSDSGSMMMPYDVAAERYVLASSEPKRYANAPVPAKDLEVLVTLLEVAALSLSDRPGATFKVEQLIDEARSIAGEGVEIDERDARIVLEKASFVVWAPGQTLSLK